jgi:hypothetical protein
LLAFYLELACDDYHSSQSQSTHLNDWSTFKQKIHGRDLDLGV